MPLIPALRKQRQADLCEFEASLVYKGSKAIEKPCLEKTKKQKEGLLSILAEQELTGPF